MTSPAASESNRNRIMGSPFSAEVKVSTSQRLFALTYEFLRRRSIIPLSAGENYRMLMNVKRCHARLFSFATFAGTMIHPQQYLPLFLRLTAALLILAVFAVAMPHAWMSVIHDKLGLGALPELPL